MRTRFNLKFFFSRIFSKHIDTPNSLTVHVLFSAEKLARLFLMQEFKPFPGRKMIKLLTLI